VVGHFLARAGALHVLAATDAHGDEHKGGNQIDGVGGLARREVNGSAGRARGGWARLRLRLREPPSIQRF
jgi:hypothetical protein